MSDKKIILFSSPEYVSGELFLLEEMLATTPILLHIKKNHFQFEDYKSLLKKYPERIFFHSEDEKIPLSNRHGIKYQHSASFHSWEELEKADISQLAYFFLSPFFDSISKVGYLANASLLNKENVTQYCDQLVALGGLKAENLDYLKAHGIQNIALLGAIWKTSSPVKNILRYCEIWL